MTEPRHQHPIAKERLPAYTVEERAVLVADVKAYGFRNWNVFEYEDQILVGFERYRVGCELGIEPQLRAFEGTEPEAVAFLESHDILRRPLGQDWLAWYALKYYGADTTERAAARRGHRSDLDPKNLGLFPDTSYGRTDDELARRFLTTRYYIQTLRRLRKRAPELFDAIGRRDLTLTQALDALRKQLAWKPPALPPRSYSLRKPERSDFPSGPEGDKAYHNAVEARAATLAALGPEVPDWLTGWKQGTTTINFREAGRRAYFWDLVKQVGRASEPDITLIRVLEHAARCEHYQRDDPSPPDAPKTPTPPPEPVAGPSGDDAEADERTGKIFPEEPTVPESPPEPTRATETRLVKKPIDQARLVKKAIDQARRLADIVATIQMHDIEVVGFNLLRLWGFVFTVADTVKQLAPEGSRTKDGSRKLLLRGGPSGDDAAAADERTGIATEEPVAESPPEPSGDDAPPF